MSKKSNPTLIGGFVVGAAILLAGGVALFGGAELFAEREVYVAYFEENAQGLREGSNVMLNGVRIGYVSGMALVVDENSFNSQTEVTLEILPESFVIIRDGEVVGEGMESTVTHEQLIHEGGLRASLQAESLVTGQLLVELEFRPDTQAMIRGGQRAAHPEIPTIPSNIQEILQKIQTWVAELNENFDMKKFGENVESILKGVDELVNSTDVRESLAGLNSIINKEDTQQLTTTLQVTLKELTIAADDAGKLFQDADATVVSLRTDLKPVLEKVSNVLDEAQRTLASANYQLQGESTESYQLGTTLKEVEGAARSLREFLDYLERNPEAVIRGKKQ